MGVINTSSHAKALKKVTEKGINFIGGGQEKLLTVLIGEKEKNRLQSIIVNAQGKKKEQNTINY